MTLSLSDHIKDQTRLQDRGYGYNYSFVFSRDLREWVEGSERTQGRDRARKSWLKRKQNGKQYKRTA